MTKSSFVKLLREHGIDEKTVVFDDPVRDGYCVKKNYYKWEVSYRERGIDYDCVGFPSESAALLYLLSILIGEDGHNGAD